MLKFRSISHKDSFILVAKVIAKEDLLNGDNSAFLGCEMSSEKDQAIAPSQEVLQRGRMCLDAADFSPDDGSVCAEAPQVPLEFFHCIEP